MKRFGIALALVGVASLAYFQTSNVRSGTDLHSANSAEFIAYMSKYGKSYATKEEFEHRLQIYVQTKAKITARNSQNLSYRLGINKFSDWTKEEYRRMLKYKKNGGYSKFLGKKQAPEVKILDETDIPKEVDWRKHKAVNYVQDQEQCGSCWAFSAVAAIEGHHAIKTGQLIKLSEQQLVDCAGGVYGNEGCDGGDMAAAMNYTMSYPLMTEDEYPYYAYDETCTFNRSEGVVSVTAINSVTPNNSTQLLAAVAQGPVSVAIDADSDDFQNYDWGIFMGFCGDDLDHGVTVVGYSISGGYYIVRNSWGSDWGDDGYIKLAIESGEGQCGIQMEPVWPETN